MGDKRRGYTCEHGVIITEFKRCIKCGDTALSQVGQLTPVVRANAKEPKMDATIRMKNVSEAQVKHVINHLRMIKISFEYEDNSDRHKGQRNGI